MATKSKHVAEKPVITSVKMLPREREALREMARREKRSMGAQLRYLIQQADKPKAAA